MQKTKTKSIPEKLVSLVKHPFSRKNKPLLHTIEWVFILLAFFAIGLPILYYQSGENIFGGGKLKSIGTKEPSAPPSEAEKKFIGETVLEPVDTSGWDTYRNQWYGFEIRHPDSWTGMQYKTSTTKNSSYETIYKFRKDASGEGDPYIGFDVAIYSTRKVKSIQQTDDLIRKEDAPEDTSNCRFSEELTLGEENNVFQKVSVRQSDACFEPAYFFSVAKDNYLYDVIPVAKEGADSVADPEKDVNKNFPEYKEVASSIKFIPVSRPAAKSPVKPRISARRPVSAKVAGGRLVCAKKNDKPSKSKKNKPGHLDLECCLDPDERPNPWCSY
ncbi:MAG: hypothetical protein WC726_03840 [Parcubacteria group bacterium]|jgi:hypothetical protein